MNKPSILLFLTSICGPLLAQSDTPPPPPHVRVPPPGSAWVVKVEHPEAPKKENNASAPEEGERILSVPVHLSLKSGHNGVTAGTILYSDKRQEKFYVTGDFLIQQSSNSKNVMVMPVKTSEANPFSLRVASFPGLAWLSKGKYEGREKKDGADCLRFSHAEMVGDPPEPGMRIDAWIRAEDSHPVAVLAGDWTYRFSEVTLFPGNVSLPETFRAAIVRQQAERNALDVIRRINEGRRKTR